MENKINIAKILKDCPTGMKLNCTMYENIEFDYIDKTPEVTYPIQCLMKTNKGYESVMFTSYGCIDRHPNAKCVIFPKGKTTWEGFELPCQFTEGDIISNGRCICIFNGKEDDDYYGFYVGVGNIDIPNYFINSPQNNYFTKGNTHVATEKEKQKLFDAIKANGYKWNTETKTLEKLVKPKFKVGDRIRHKQCYISGVITKIDGDCYKIKYDSTAVIFTNIKYQDDWELAPDKKEETMEGTNKTIFQANAQGCDIMNDIIKDNMETITIDDFKANTKEWLIDKLHNMIINDAIKTIGNIHNELHKPQYPKTYEECCKILMGKTDFQDYSLVLTKLSTNKNEENSISPKPPHITLINNFYKLLICRDAYWKIAGEQMGLRKPWKPDWNDCKDKFCITIFKNKPISVDSRYINSILAFPTSEIRDTFYENFKDLINETKELL